MKIKQIIKQEIMSHPWLYAIGQIIRNRNDSEYLEQILGIKNNPRIVCLEDYQPGIRSVPKCDIVAGTGNDGFFACIRWALDGVYFCKKYGFDPIVHFPENSLYKDSSMPKNVNPFNYYYCEIGNKKGEKNILSSRIKFMPRNSLLAEYLNQGISYRVSDKYIDEMSLVMKEYFHFNSKTLIYLENAINKYKINKNVLGVHVRGTDYRGNYANHPTFIEPSVYYQYIDEAIRKYSFDRIFLATDDKEILQEFLNHYGNEKIIYNPDVKRGSDNIGIHVIDSVNGNRNGYEKGLEVIGDMYILSSCGGIISSMSQVALISRIYKKSRNETFTYDYIIDKGINSNKKIFDKK